MTKKTEVCRCSWVDIKKLDYVAYHDKEWGVAIYDDRLLFELLTLEAAQAGLSWYTVLRKRNNYRVAFSNFDAIKVANYDESKIQKIILNPGIIRNKAKIYSTVNNAQKFLEVQKQFGSFHVYIWEFVNGKPIINTIKSPKDYVSTSKVSDSLSNDLKSRGFKFVGSTIIYAYMQAIGMVNDHQVNCFRRQEIINGVGNSIRK